MSTARTKRHAAESRPAHLANASRLAARVATSGGAAESEAPIVVRSPFDLEVVGEVPRSSPADVAEAARRSRRAQEEWSKRTFDERARVFLAFHDLVLERQD